MTGQRKQRLVIISAAALALLSWTQVRAEDAPAAAGSVVSQEQIEQALKPAKTRGLHLRGLKRVDAGSESASVNLNVPFEYNSSQLLPAATVQLSELKGALSAESLRNDRFEVAGHTDAKGNPKYNHQLSLRRAEAVKRFLIAGGVDPARLQTVGYGSDHPLTPEHPEDPQNRRVEIRDLGEARQGAP